MLHFFSAAFRLRSEERSAELNKIAMKEKEARDAKKAAEAAEEAANFHILTWGETRRTGRMIKWKRRKSSLITCTFAWFPGLFPSMCSTYLEGIKNKMTQFKELYWIRPLYKCALLLFTLWCFLRYCSPIYLCLVSQLRLHGRRLAARARAHGTCSAVVGLPIVPGQNLPRAFHDPNDSSAVSTANQAKLWSGHYGEDLREMFWWLSFVHLSNHTPC